MINYLRIIHFKFGNNNKSMVLVKWSARCRKSKIVLVIVWLTIHCRRHLIPRCFPLHYYLALHCFLHFRFHQYPILHCHYHYHQYLPLLMIVHYLLHLHRFVLNYYLVVRLSFYQLRLHQFLLYVAKVVQ